MNLMSRSRGVLFEAWSPFRKKILYFVPNFVVCDCACPLLKMLAPPLNCYEFVRCNISLHFTINEHRKFHHDDSMLTKMLQFCFSADDKQAAQPISTCCAAAEAPVSPVRFPLPCSRRSATSGDASLPQPLDSSHHPYTTATPPPLRQPAPLTPP